MGGTRAKPVPHSVALIGYARENSDRRALWCVAHCRTVPAATARLGPIVARAPSPFNSSTDGAKYGTHTSNRPTAIFFTVLHTTAPATKKWWCKRVGYGPVQGYPPPKSLSLYTIYTIICILHLAWHRIIIYIYTFLVWPIIVLYLYFFNSCNIIYSHLMGRLSGYTIL